jgi:glycosyltransferase involved in cell wall biosynthesis
MTKVLMVIDSLRLGGAERVLATLSAVAPAAGFTFDVVVLSERGTVESVMEPVLASAGVHIRYLSARRLSNPRLVPHLAGVIRASRCDVVHAHLEDASTLVPVAARLVGIPAVCSFHHVVVPLARREALKERLAVMAANRSAGIIFVSRASAESFARAYGGARDRWRIIENGVDLEAFSVEPARLPDDLGVDDGAPVVAMVGALRARKGHAVALEAWPTVRRAFPNARLLIVGDGPDRPRLCALAHELGISDSLILAGIRRDVALLMQAAALVILPSEHEALPTTLMEAAACGRPVVATEVDGVPEVVRDGDTGLLVPVNDAPALARGIIDLLGNGRRRAEMGRRARLLAEERFSSQRWARRLSDLYRSVTRASVVYPR